MKVVINKCFGGFGLSHKAVMRYAELSGFALYPYLNHIVKRVYGDKATLDNPDVLRHYSRVPIESLPTDADGNPKVPSEAYFYEGDIERHDPVLVRVVEELGGGHRINASGQYSNLQIVEIPDGVEYTIEEYDGQEHIAETHRTWA